MKDSKTQNRLFKKFHSIYSRMKPERIENAPKTTQQQSPKFKPRSPFRTNFHKSQAIVKKYFRQCRPVTLQPKPRQSRYYIQVSICVSWKKISRVSIALPHLQEIDSQSRMPEIYSFDCYELYAPSFVQPCFPPTLATPGIPCSFVLGTHECAEQAPIDITLPLNDTWSCFENVRVGFPYDITSPSCLSHTFGSRSLNGATSSNHINEINHYSFLDVITGSRPPNDSTRFRHADETISNEFFHFKPQDELEQIYSTAYELEASTSCIPSPAPIQRSVSAPQSQINCGFSGMLQRCISVAVTEQIIPRIFSYTNSRCDSPLNGISLFYSTSKQAMHLTSNGNNTVTSGQFMNSIGSIMKTTNPWTSAGMVDFTFQGAFTSMAPFPNLIANPSPGPSLRLKSTHELQQLRRNIYAKSLRQQYLRAGKITLSKRKTLLPMAFPPIRCKSCPRKFSGPDRIRNHARHRIRVHGYMQKDPMIRRSSPRLHMRPCLKRKFSCSSSSMEPSMGLNVRKGKIPNNGPVFSLEDIT